MTNLMVDAQKVHKSFGAVEVLKGIDFQVAPGQVICLLGPSGSGKSTFLRCINHLEKINAGRLFVDGELVGYRQHGDKLHELSERDVAKKRTEIGMVFQHFNLFPHMTAMGNIIEAPLQVKNEPKAEVRQRATELLAKVGLADKATPIPANYRADSSSGWPSPGRSRCSPSSCCSMSRPQRSTPNWSATSSPSCRISPGRA